MLCIVIHYKIEVNTSWKGNLCVEAFFLFLEMLTNLLLRHNNWNYNNAIRYIFIFYMLQREKYQVD